MSTSVVKPKKESSRADGVSRDGLTGMGFHTKKHFIEVKQKMNDYIGQQQDYEYYDQMQPHPQSHHREHHLDLTLLDGKRATKPHSSSSHTSTSHKQLVHPGLVLPQSDHRFRKPSPRPAGAK